MALFQTTSEIKAHVSTLNKNTDFATLLPYVEQAEIKYIIPVLSEDEYTNIETAYQAGNLTAAQQTLLTKVQRALAYYTLYEYLPFSNVTLGEMGAQEVRDSEGTSAPAAQWRYNNLALNALENGDVFTEQFLRHLELNKATFTDWAASESYTLTKDLFISGAQDLSAYITVDNPRRTFLALRPHIVFAEEKFIIPAISQEFYDELKAEVLAGTVTVANQKVIDRIKNCLAFLALHEALPTLPISISAKGLKVLSSNDGITQKMLAPPAMLTDLRVSNLNKGEMQLANLKYFLDDNVSDYPTYRNSDEVYNEQPKTLPLDNSNSESFWT